MFVAKLLDMPTVRVEEANEDAAMMHYGYRDMAGPVAQCAGPVQRRAARCRSGSSRA